MQQRLSSTDLAMLELYREQLRRQGALAYQVQGTSMYPLLQQGDRLFVTSSGSEPAPGAILVYWDPYQQALVAHRYLFATTDHLFLICKGDNTIRSDAPVLREQILGQLELLSDDLWLTRIVSAISRSQARFPGQPRDGNRSALLARIFFGLTRRMIWILLGLMRKRCRPHLTGHTDQTGRMP
ncbi:MAG: S24/S26 family peptidase [Leptospiraceae bacterium]|nr:S24/S26 family peptidase [Leptospiraceae bacterium]